jgi:hypothetical protein
MVDLDRLPERKRMKLEAQMEQAAEAQQREQQIQMEMLKRNLGEMDAKIQNLSAQAMKSQAQAQLAQSQVGVDAFKAEADYEVRTDETGLKAAEVGVKLDKNEMDATRMGIEAAYKVAEQMERNEDRKERKEQANGGQTDQGQQGSNEGEE